MSTLTLLRAALAIGTVVTVGCAPATTGRSHRHAASAMGPTTGAMRDVIAGEELRELRGASALDAVRRLRPEWFSRSAIDGAPRALPVLYIDGARAGDAGMLRDVRAESVRAIRYYSPNEAKTRFGRWDDAGVLHVLIVRQGGQPPSIR